MSSFEYVLFVYIAVWVRLLEAVPISKANFRILQSTWNAALDKISKLKSV